MKQTIHEVAREYCEVMGYTYLGIQWRDLTWGSWESCWFLVYLKPSGAKAYLRWNSIDAARRAVKAARVSKVMSGDVSR